MAENSCPSGILTFLFTDIQGSTPLWEKDPVGMAEALNRHNTALNGAIEAHGGRVFKIIGDEFQVVFEDPLEAVKAAVAGQRALTAVKWGRVGPLIVRMGIHTGPAVWEGTDYAVSHTFNRTARIMSCGHGGQILLSAKVVDQIGDKLPQEVTLRDRGRLSLKGMTLREHLFQVVAPGLEESFPPLKTEVVSPQAIPNNLPLAATSFVGRDQELAEIDALISDPEIRLVTIVGPGGMGKTRLALAAAEMQLKKTYNHEPRFPNGVFFVALEALDSAEQIPSAINKALGFRPSADDPANRSTWQQTVDYLRSKRTLLVMDNFEQLLDGAELLVSLHRTASNVKILATSREKLALRGECLFPLQGMDHPESIATEMDRDYLLDNYAAPRLFLQSARRLRPDFTIVADEVFELGHICHLVDGMPLALELAAGWVELLSLDDIAAEISESLDVLETELRDVPQRQRSMTAVFEGSWRRLGDDEQTVLEKLSVFRGGFTREAARQVAGASLRQLAALAGKALIQYDKDKDRYQIHRLLRQFGAHKLARDPAAEKLIRERHCAYYCAALQQWDTLLKGPAQLETLAKLDIESANTLAAWSFAAQTKQFAQIDRGADGLGRFYLWRRLFHEGENANRLAEVALNQALAAAEGKVDASEIKRILAKVHILHSLFCKQTKANKLVGQALKLLDSPDMAGVDTRRERAFGLLRMGDLAFKSDGHDPLPFYQQSLSLYQSLGDGWETAQVLTELGWAAAHKGAMTEAHRFGEKALDLARGGGDCKLTADVLWLLGTLAIIEGDVEKSSRLLGESLDIRKMLGDRITDIASGPLDLGMTLTWIGRMAEADEIREEALTFYQEQGQPEQIALAHVRLATSKLHVGQFDAAEHHAQIGLQLCREAGIQRGAGVAFFVLGSAGHAGGELDQSAALMQESIAIFRNIEGAGEAGWVLGAYAAILQQQGQPAEAKKYICEAMQNASGALGLISLLICLPIYAELLLNEGREALALEVHALLERYPIFTTSLVWPNLYDQTRLAALKAAFPPEAVVEAERKGRARDLQETAAEVLAELEQDLAGLP